MRQFLSIGVTVEIKDVAGQLTIGGSIVLHGQTVAGYFNIFRQIEKGQEVTFRRKGNGAIFAGLPFTIPHTALHCAIQGAYLIGGGSVNHANAATPERHLQLVGAQVVDTFQIEAIGFAKATDITSGGQGDGGDGDVGVKGILLAVAHILPNLRHVGRD